MPEQTTSELVLPPILYWSPSRAADLDACESAPGVLIDTASRHGLVLAAMNDSWQVLDRLPDDAVRLVAEPLPVDPGPELNEQARTTGRCSQCGKGFAELACGPTHAVAAGLWFGGQQQAHVVEELRRERDAAIDRAARGLEATAKDGDADELLLVRDDERMSGRTTIGHSRLPAAVIATRLLGGAPHDAIRKSYPDVTDEQLRVLAGLLADYRLVAKVADVEAIANWCDGIARKAEAQGWRDLALTAPVIARELRRAAVGEPLLNTGHGLDDAARDVVEYLAAAGKLRGAEPTAAEPWTATVSWTPQQNAGAVSLLDGRTPLFAILGSLAAGEIPEVVAADYGAQVESVRVLDVLRRELAEREAASRTERLRARVAELESRLRVHAESELEDVALSQLLPTEADDAMPVELAVSVLQNATLTDRETHALRSLAAVLDRTQLGQQELGPPEPRWVACAGCVGRIDRHEPHVAETFALEVLHGRHELETRTARPGRRWHEHCAPDTWTGAR